MPTTSGITTNTSAPTAETLIANNETVDETVQSKSTNTAQNSKASTLTTSATGQGTVITPRTGDSNAGFVLLIVPFTLFSLIYLYSKKLKPQNKLLVEKTSYKEESKTK